MKPKLKNDIDPILASIFNVSNVTQPLSPLSPLIKGVPRETKDDKNKEDLENDYNYARNNFKNIIDIGTGAMVDLVNLSKTMQTEESFNALSRVIKSLTDCNKELIEMHKKMEIEKKKNEIENKQNSTINVEKGIFIGSTSDLQDLIEKNKK